MSDQTSSVKYKGVTYKVILDEYRQVWFVDPKEREQSKKQSETRTAIDDRRADNIVEAEQIVLEMLERSDR